ncbi:MAG: tetratricopeptide repeat protein [Bacteroidota bacterium]
MSKKKKSKVTVPKKSIATTKSKSSKKGVSLPTFFNNVKVNCVIIMAFSFLLYGMTMFYEYTQDDAIVITENMFTKEGVSGIGGILGNDTFYGFFKRSGKATLVEGGRYRPFTLVMFALEWQIFGDNPLWFHFFTVFLYGLTGIIFYLLLLKMLQPIKGESYALFVALIASLIFIAHPIHTEVVANIKGRDEIVALLGSLAALYYSLKHYYEKNINFNFIAGGIFFLALMSKENAITFCAIVPMTYFVFTKADIGTIFKQTVPFLGMAVLFMVIRTSVLGWSFGGACTELMNCPYLKVEGGRYVPYTFNEKFGTIFYTLGQYVKLLFFPHPLTHDYYPYHVGVMSFSDWRSILSLLLYLGLGIYALMGILKKDAVAYGIMFYLMTISIVSNIVFPVGTNMAERFAFMPSAGFSLVIAVLLYRLIKPASAEEKKGLKPVNLTLPLAIAGVVLVAFSGKTIERNPAWKDNYTLFMTDVEVSQNSAKLRNSAGGSAVEAAAKLPENSTERTQLLNEAVGHLQEAIRIHPNYKNAYLLLGNAKQYLKRFDEAIQHYNQALRVDEEYPDAINNLNLAYRNGAKHFTENGNSQKALQYLQYLEKSNTNDVEIFNLFARNYGQLNNINKSFEYLNKAEQVDPNSVETMRLYGIAYGMIKDTPRAIQYLERALKIQPENPSIMFNLGIALQQAGDMQRAQQMMTRAKQLDPSLGQ